MVERNWNFVVRSIFCLVLTGFLAGMLWVPAASAHNRGVLAIQPLEWKDLSSEEPQGGPEWGSVRRQSMMFLSMQHGFRLMQEKTTRELGGPFFKDYASSVKGLKGWGDGDGVFTNYVAHPMQGAVSGFVFLNNNSDSACLEFGNSRRYWKSRLKAFAFAAFYSTQFELGPFSEATVGNVGMNHGTSGWVDFVMTPVGGLGWMVAEDAVDRFVIRRLEKKWKRPAAMRFFRIALNPTRSLANVFRLKLPWHRPGRPVNPPLESDSLASQKGASCPVAVGDLSKPVASEKTQEEGL
jgi:hypothetical protein